MLPSLPGPPRPTARPSCATSRIIGLPGLPHGRPAQPADDAVGAWPLLLCLAVRATARRSLRAGSGRVRVAARRGAGHGRARGVRAMVSPTAGGEAWRGSSTAPGRTHHLAGGAPLYADRFDAVLPFHEPGLAPVSRGGEAWHIDATGAAAYDRRFRQTFGFYEGRAAVQVHGGAWQHVRPDGSILSGGYEWCGNYQGGRCVARTDAGRYVHLDANGTLVGQSEGWRYAGDYREEAAVVHDDRGRATHVDPSGRLLHGAWFLDLDVFHKGLARARDEHGWLHVDRGGRPSYTRRFLEVEAFYNGQARVRRFDGAVEVITEAGVTVREVHGPEGQRLDDFTALSADLVGFWRTQTLSAAVNLGVFELLPGDVAALSGKTGVAANQLQRLLRALGELHVVQEHDGTWSATPRGEFLHAEHPMTLADAALEYGDQMTAAWRALPAALRGDPEFRPDIFREVARDPSRRERHHRMLRSYARHDYAGLPEVLALGAEDLVLDVGGGTGELAAKLLWAYPQLKVALVDLPEVLREHLVGEGVGRLQLCPADLERDDWGAGVPKADAAVFARVLHDFADREAVRLLLQARQALRPGGRVFVVEFLRPEVGFDGGLCDLHLLAVTGGRERSRGELARLLAAAGLAVVEVRSLPTLPCVVVAEVGPDEPSLEGLGPAEG